MNNDEFYKKFLIKLPNEIYEKFLIILDYIFHYLGIFFLVVIFSLLPICYILVYLGFNIPIQVAYVLITIDFCIVWLINL